MIGHSNYFYRNDLAETPSLETGKKIYMGTALSVLVEVADGRKIAVAGRRYCR